MKKLIKIAKEIIFSTLIIIGLMMAFTIMFGAAAPDTSALDNVVEWIAVWAGRIGLVVAFFGGIQTALAFKNDDADGKVRGLKTLVSGFMVYGISKSLDLFGL